jgi:hypothetical protein
MPRDRSRQGHGVQTRRQTADAAGRDAALQHLQKVIDEGLGQGELVILV